MNRNVSSDSILPVPSTTSHAPLILTNRDYIMELVRGVSRRKMMFLLILLPWATLTFVDFYSTEFR